MLDIDAISKENSEIAIDEVQNRPSGTSLVKVLSSLALNYVHQQRWTVVQYPAEARAGSCGVEGTGGENQQVDYKSQQRQDTAS